MLESILYGFLFFGLPIVTIGLFFFALIMFLSARWKNKKSPGTFSDKQMKNRLIFLIIASIIAGAMLAVVIGFIALMFIAVAFM